MADRGAEIGPMPTRLETERLVLRAWRASDADAYHRMWTERDPRSLRTIDADGHPTAAELAERLRDQLAEQRTTGIGFLAVVRRSPADPAEAQVVGYCGLLRRSGEDLDGPELGYEFLRAAFGHGYATEAAMAVAGAARACGHRRLWASVRVWNAASFRVLDKLGFVRSGRVDPDPDRGDTVWLSLDLTADRQLSGNLPRST